MNLKSFGCSFIFGLDLNDCYSTTQYSQLTWPSLLSQHLGYDYQCYAESGIGNLRILENVLSQANDSAVGDLFVIGWTWIDRFDYTVEPTGPVNDYNLAFAGIDEWKTILPSDNTKISQLYYRDLHSQYRDKLVTLTYIKTAIDTLKQKNYPFIMTCIDELIFETRWNLTPAIAELYDYIRPYITTFENKTFLDFSKEKGFPVSKTLHPLTEAHQAAFELIKSYNLV
jgi:hypothetical protein